MAISTKNIRLKDYNQIMFRRLISALYEDYGLHMTTSTQKGHYRVTAHNNTRTIAYKIMGLKPKQIDSIRKNKANMTRYIGTGEKRPVRFEEPGGRILLVEVPKLGRHWEQVTIPLLEQRHYIRPGSLKMAFGLGHQDRPMSIDFSNSQSSTVGVFGITQSGKTNTLRLLVWEAILSGQADIILADVGLREKNLGIFEGASALAHPLITEPADAFSLLVWLKAEIVKRANNGERKPLFVFIDEVQTLIDYTSDYGKSDAILSDITRQCAQVGVRLIVSTQQAQIQFIGPVLNNLQVRICHKVDKARTSTDALGVKNAGAEGLLGYGDCLYKSDDGLHRMSVARLDEKKDANQYDRIERGSTRTIPALAKTLTESAAPNIPVNSSHPAHVPDDLDYGQIASVIFEPSGINKLKKRFGIGPKKAKRLQMAAKEIRAYAYHNNHKALPAPDEEVIDAVKNESYNWLSGDWREV